VLARVASSQSLLLGSLAGFLLKKTVIAMWLGLGSALLLGGAAGGQDSPGVASLAARQPPEANGSTSGKAGETMNAAGYTYVRVDTGEKQVWFAAPRFEVAVGDEVEVPAGAEMRDHYSKVLDRSFEVIYFVGGVRVGGATDDSSESPFRYSGAGGAAAADAFDFSGITKADGGNTIAEIFDAGSDLAGRSVSVRGRVVKFSAQILGVNFLHLRDGTSSKQGHNDLTVTTKAEVAVGSLVVVSGVVTADKDFGFGYRYDLIIEDASLTAE
jgi:hypothetical protein